MSEANFDLAIVDLSLKESHGMDLIKDLRVRHPELLVLVVSMHEESPLAERVLRAGEQSAVDILPVYDGVTEVLAEREAARFEDETR